MKSVVAISMCLLLLFGMAGCGKPPVVKFTLTLSTTGEGTLTPSSGTQYNKGTLVELIPTANSGWTFSKWDGPDAARVVTDAGKHKILMSKDMSLVAVFVKSQYEVTTNVVPPDGGSIEVSLAEISTSASYEEGQVIALRAVPASGYIFHHWEGDLSGTSNPTILTVDAPKNITAVFIPGLVVTGKVIGKSSHAGIANMVINYSGANSGQITTDADGCYYIEANGSITLTPVPPQNATFLAADPASIQITSSSNNIDFAVSIGTYETSWGSPDSGIVGIAAGVSDTIYITDPYKNWIQQFNKYGALLATWGSYGSADGQFNSPLGIAVDTAGNVYVADTNNNRIQKFNSDGVFLTKWGSYGSADGQFNYPTGIAVDSVGNVYVVDSNNNRVQKFNSNGTYLTQWGSLGSNVGEFDRPVYIAVDTADNVYVTEMNNQRVNKFNSNGVYLTSFGGYGNADGQFNGPLGIAFDTFDNVYVVDSYNKRIQKFTDDTFLAKWDRPTSTHNQFYYPVCIALDSINNIYITDNSSIGFVMKFNQIQ